jgi:hypothetical protein
MKTCYTCSWCGQPFEANCDLAGLRVKCRMCGQVQQMPDADSLPATANSAYELLPPTVPPAIPAAAPVELMASPVTHSRRPSALRLAWQKWFSPWVLETSHVQGLGTWLVILSAADLFMTFALLRRSPLFIESNPVAQYFFARWDMAGMVFFKFSIIGGVILVSEIIERHRPGWGRFVLFVGCAGAVYAITQGARLYMGADNAPMEAALD